MKNLFNDISHEERRRILEMHERATKRNYLMEQDPTGGSQTTTPPTTNNQTDVRPAGTQETTTQKLTRIKNDKMDAAGSFVSVHSSSLKNAFGITDPSEWGKERNFKTDGYEWFRATFQPVLKYYLDKNLDPNTPEGALSKHYQSTGAFKDNYSYLISKTPTKGATSSIQIANGAQDMDTRFAKLFNAQLQKYLPTS